MKTIDLRQQFNVPHPLEPRLMRIVTTVYYLLLKVAVKAISLDKMY